MSVLFDKMGKKWSTLQSYNLAEQPQETFKIIHNDINNNGILEPNNETAYIIYRTHSWSGTIVLPRLWNSIDTINGALGKADRNFSLSTWISHHQSLKVFPQQLSAEQHLAFFRIEKLCQEYQLDLKLIEKERSNLPWYSQNTSLENFLHDLSLIVYLKIHRLSFSKLTKYLPDQLTQFPESQQRLCVSILIFLLSLKQQHYIPQKISLMNQTITTKDFVKTTLEKIQKNLIQFWTAQDHPPEKTQLLKRYRMLASMMYLSKDNAFLVVGNIDLLNPATRQSLIHELFHLYQDSQKWQSSKLAIEADAHLFAAQYAFRDLGLEKLANDQLIELLQFFIPQFDFSLCKYFGIKTVHSQFVMQRNSLQMLLSNINESYGVQFIFRSYFAKNQIIPEALKKAHQLDDNIDAIRRKIMIPLNYEIAAKIDHLKNLPQLSEKNLEEETRISDLVSEICRDILFYQAYTNIIKELQKTKKENAAPMHIIITLEDRPLSEYRQQLAETLFLDKLPEHLDGVEL